jgi:multicomponent Na+:H+ antiporter subunit D
MSQQYPALLVIVPLLSALLISAAGWVNKRLCFPIAVAAMAVATYSAVGLLLRVLSEGAITYRLGGWPPPWGIAYYVDHLNGLILTVVSVVALINLLGSRKSIEQEFSEKTWAFYTLYVLMVTGLLGIVVTGDAFNLYVLLEIASLTGYGLIGMGEGRAPLATLNYVYMGTISGYRISVYCHWFIEYGRYCQNLTLLVPIQGSFRCLYYQHGWGLAQNGLLSFTCLASQCLYICPFRSH